jgi:eukaryotic-like serine/threonine-protein kinase
MAPADSAPLSLPPGPGPANDGGELLANRYRLGTLLGKGGMGEVWAATDLKLKREVAIKLIHRKLADHPDFARSFVMETELVARLRHPNIPQLHTVETAPDGRLFMVMELVRGITLRRLMERQGKVPPVRMICYAMYATEALGCAHEAGIRHRDIKPENLIVSEDEARASVLDFGIAKRVLEQAVVAGRRAAGGQAGTSKRRSTLLGTPGYVPPEAALGREVDHRADFFQLGVTIYEAISGRKPFPVRADDKTGMLSALLFDDPPPLPEDECPAGLWIILERLLAKAPEHRYDSADALLAAFLALLSQFRESVPAGHLRALVLQKDQQKQTVRKALARSTPPAEAPKSAPRPVRGGGPEKTEPMPGRSTLPLGAAFVARGPGFHEATAEPVEEGRGTLPMPAGFVPVSPTSPQSSRRSGVQEKEQEAVTAPLWVATPEPTSPVPATGVPAVAVAPARSAVAAPAPVQVEVAAPVRVEVAAPTRVEVAAEAARAVPAVLPVMPRSPMVPALILAAVSIAVLGMGIGMMVQVRYGQRAAEERPAATASAGPTATASTVPAATASAGPTATASAGPTAMASAGPTAMASAGPTAMASTVPAATTKPTTRPAPAPKSTGDLPVPRSSDVVDPFSSPAKKAAPPKPLPHPKLVF